MKFANSEEAICREVESATVREGVVLISGQLMLRSNLSAAANIALVRQYRFKAGAREAQMLARALLEECGFAKCAEKPNSELTQQETFVVKMACAAMFEMPILVIDRPASMLSGLRYPPFLAEIIGFFSHRYREHCVMDYSWNEPLYQGLL